MQKIAEKFELSEFSVISARVRFCQALLSKKEDLIKWPKVCTHTHTLSLSLKNIRYHFLFQGKKLLIHEGNVNLNS